MGVGGHTAELEAKRADLAAPRSSTKLLRQHGGGCCANGSRGAIAPEHARRLRMDPRAAGRKIWEVGQRRRGADGGRGYRVPVQEPVCFRLGLHPARLLHLAHVGLLVGVQAPER